MARGVIPIWARVIGRERKLESLEEQKRELQGKLRFSFRSRQEKDEIADKIKIIDEHNITLPNFAVSRPPTPNAAFNLTDLFVIRQ